MKAINITYCDCNKFIEKNKWKSYKKIEEVISKRIREQLPRARLEFKELILPEKIKERVENHVEAVLKEKEYNVKVFLKLAKCNLCEKEGSQYFEAVLQIRSANIDVLEKSVEELKKQVSMMKNKGMFINKVETLKEGYNLFMTNKKLTQILAKDLQNRFGGSMKASAQLFSKNHLTSKNIYRVNIILRLPDFVKGDIISIEDKVFKIEGVGKQIKLLSLIDNKKISKKYDKIEEHKLLTKHQTYISRTHPNLEVINPYDYQSSFVKSKHSPGSFTNGQKIKVVVHKGVYIC